MVRQTEDKRGVVAHRFCARLNFNAHRRAACRFLKTRKASALF
jgi:hypothetical protein